MMRAYQAFVHLPVPVPGTRTSSLTRTSAAYRCQAVVHLLRRALGLLVPVPGTRTSVYRCQALVHPCTGARHSYISLNAYDHLTKRTVASALVGTGCFASPTPFNATHFPLTEKQKTRLTLLA